MSNTQKTKSKNVMGKTMDVDDVLDEDIDGVPSGDKNLDHIIEERMSGWNRGSHSSSSRCCCCVVCVRRHQVRAPGVVPCPRMHGIQSDEARAFVEAKVHGAHGFEDKVQNGKK